MEVYIVVCIDSGILYDLAVFSNLDEAIKCQDEWLKATEAEAKDVDIFIETSPVLEKWS